MQFIFISFYTRVGVCQKGKNGNIDYLRVVCYDKSWVSGDNDKPSEKRLNPALSGLSSLLYADNKKECPLF